MTIQCRDAGCEPRCAFGCDRPAIWSFSDKDPIFQSGMKTHGHCCDVHLGEVLVLPPEPKLAQVETSSGELEWRYPSYVELIKVNYVWGGHPNSPYLAWQSFAAVEAAHDRSRKVWSENFMRLFDRERELKRAWKAGGGPHPRDLHWLAWTGPEGEPYTSTWIGRAESVVIAPVDWSRWKPREDMLIHIPRPEAVFTDESKCYKLPPGIGHDLALSVARAANGMCASTADLLGREW